MISAFTRIGAAAVALGMAGATLPLGAADAAQARPVDMGTLAANAGDQAITLTLALKLNDLAGAEDMMRRVSTQGDPLFQHFLTPTEALAKFGPSQATADIVTSQLRLAGLAVERKTSTTLSVTGAASTIERVFQTSLHQFQAAATASAPATSFRAAVGGTTVPAGIAPAVTAVAGFSTKPSFHPHLHYAPDSFAQGAIQAVAPKAASGNPPGQLTVLDFAAHYNVNPLYKAGVTGKGRTVGIVTLASFTPSDAFTYWSSLGLTVDPNRLTVVNIDGGPGAPSDASGSDETTLDVEQSGGIAPGAKIIVYQAPNTNQGFLDAFAAAIESNKADSVSTSWGEWEFFDDLAQGPVTDPFSGETVSSLQALHELLVLAALEGQSFFAAAGDCGAFDVFDEVAANFTTPLSVDNPGSDTAITAGGGTTLPVTLNFKIRKTGQTVTINVPQERVWGWDYLEPLCTAEGEDPVTCGIFPAGGGGGVSVFFGLPFYQLLTPGIQASQPGQLFQDTSTTPPTTDFALPAHFLGRNVPDISFNADPETGYILDYTSNVHGFRVETGGGGTSFVAPQLNGVTALLDQNAGHRMGLLNPTLYALQLLGFSRGPLAAINTITAGDNWFYVARNGYAPAAGLGVLNVANLALLTR